ncbi:MAG: cell division protein ZapA [Neisseria sp.]
MSIEQVSVEIMKRQFTFGTPTSEKETLLQAVEMLSHKIDAVREGGRVIENDKIVILAALNVVHDLLKMKMTTSDDLAIGDFERRMASLIEMCDTAVAKAQ